MTKTITLLASGTRGDVQPYVALGIGLRDAGYAVRVAAHDAFAPFIHNWGLEFFSLGENPSDLFYRAENRGALRAGNNPLRAARASFAYWQMARPVYAQLVQNAWIAIQHSDAAVYGLPTFWAGALAHTSSIAPVRAFMQPLTPTRTFPCPLLPMTRSLGGMLNRLSYTLCFAFMRWAWHDALRIWQKKSNFARVFPDKQETLTLYAFSQQLVPRPRDYPAQHHITGFWFLPERAWSPPAALESFLRAGDAPIYFGFGSAQTSETASASAMLLRVQRATGSRFLIHHPLANDHFPRASFFVLDDVPHAWLFPRVRAVIHHGGAGTMAAALRAGVPQICAPIYSDSFFWSARVHACGLGPPPLPESAMSDSALREHLNALRGDNPFSARAREFSNLLAREHGVNRAVGHLQNWV